MQIIVSEIHLQDSAIKNEAIGKISKLSKYHSRIEKIEIKLIVKKNKTNPFCCELKIAIPGKDLEIIDYEKSLGAALDKAFERAKRILVKAKEKKLTKRHSAAVAEKSKKFKTS